MNRRTKHLGMGRKQLLLAALAGLPALVFAQVPVDENGNPLSAVVQDDGGYETPYEDFDAAESGLDAAALEELVGPVALYPDDLLAIVLPASTYPLEIVQAARFLERLEDDSSLKPDEDWDESVVALLNYPDVVRMMDEEIDWTWKLGEAVISQQTEVIAAVESFRDRAYAAGNLQSDEYQTVSYDEGTIEIEPANEEIIYVPYYEPTEVIVRQPRRVYYYYPDPYPVYYYPYPAGYRFRHGYFWGVTTAFTIGWSNHYLHVHHPSYWGHPYYGRHYVGHYYRRPSINIYNSYYVQNSYRRAVNRHRDGDYWRPRHRSGARQAEPRVRNYHRPPNRRDANYRDDRRQRERAVVRRDGRMDLNLRERNRTNQRNRSDGSVDSRRAGSRDATNTRRNDNTNLRRSERGVSTERRSAGNRNATRSNRDASSRQPAAGQNRDTSSRSARERSTTADAGRSTSRRSNRNTESGNTYTFRSRPNGNSERSRRSSGAGVTTSRQRQQTAPAPAGREATRPAERRSSSATSRPSFTSQRDSRRRSSAAPRPENRSSNTRSRSAAPRPASRASAPRVERQSRSAPAPRQPARSDKRSSSRGEDRKARSSNRSRNRN